MQEEQLTRLLQPFRGFCNRLFRMYPSVQVWITPALLPGAPTHRTQLCQGCHKHCRACPQPSPCCCFSRQPVEICKILRPAHPHIALQDPLLRHPILPSRPLIRLLKNRHSDRNRDQHPPTPVFPHPIPRSRKLHPWSTTSPEYCHPHNLFLLPTPLLRMGAAMHRPGKPTRVPP